MGRRFLSVVDGVDEDEPDTRHLVPMIETLHHGQQPLVVDRDGAVDLLVVAATPLGCVSSATAADKDGDARDDNANAGGRRMALLSLLTLASSTHTTFIQKRVRSSNNADDVIQVSVVIDQTTTND
jgi:hypothetical protein